MKIIGLSGTNGSGKDTVGHMLSEQSNYIFVSGSDMLRDEAKERGVTPDRENLRKIGNEWRKQFGAGVLVQKAVELAEKSGKNLAIASIRSLGEVEDIQSLGGTVVWVDADPEIRFERIKKGLRGRGAEDDKTFEQFLHEEHIEMQGSDDKATLNMAAVKVQADIVINNSGSDINIFKDEAAKVLHSLL